ncbi:MULTISPECIES: hypothetical protein [unclassified Bradyrhizobium]|uniref:hypothetical protein n=1 Tax=unclassified Bradyrhizobium TaxID=2631580 RepID=UPI0028EF3744|nr:MULTISPECIES: hypothetical protein [unclassified Bradyrhizobium]
MTKLARVSASVPVSAAPSNKATANKAAAARSDWDSFLSILLFCALGLLVSLGALLLGAPLVWD